MKEIVSDLIAEQAAVDRLVANLSLGEWEREYRYEPWNIKDSIIHIAFFDYAALKLLRGEATDLMAISAESEQDEYVRQVKERGEMSPAQALDWWREMRTRMDAALYDKDPKERIPWAPGLPMSAKSLASARLMELWAHSVDVYDALGLPPLVEDRITSTLFLSWQARPNAYRINNLPLPETPLYLELTLPSGRLWTKGEPGAADSIRGAAADWALVAVRRRNWRDTGLAVSGPEARRFADIAQTYAGRPDPLPPAGT
ncbi:MAG: TIGR03084 family protein [Gracilibacteraceae bacterium]|nr:TIGR03084 family protein [Gracilibacteraceae bacterium]